MLLGKNFDDIDGETIRSLIESGATESVHLEFKMKSYGNADNDKKEFLKDVSSFANCLGGHLVIGVDEEGGVACDLRPLTGFDVDEELQRLEAITRTGIEPSIVGLRMKRIPVTDGDVIIVHVPRSHNPPHRVIFRNSNRYRSRGSAGVYELPMEELRRLFGERRTLEEQARAFLEERFLRIQAGDAAMPIPVEKGVTVIHLVPLPDLGARRRIDLAAMLQHRSKFAPMYSWGMSDRVNLDGLNVYSSDGADCCSYTQIFRNGSLEAASTGLIVEQDGKRPILSEDLPREVIKSVPAYINGLRALDVSPPILMKIVFSGMNGVALEGHGNRSLQPRLYERETLHLPHAILSEYRDNGNYQSFIAEQMDFLWNAYGLERCSLFDGNGNWKGKY